MRSQGRAGWARKALPLNLRRLWEGFDELWGVVHGGFHGGDDIYLFLRSLCLNLIPCHFDGKASASIDVRSRQKVHPEFRMRNGPLRHIEETDDRKFQTPLPLDNEEGVTPSFHLERWEASTRVHVGSEHGRLHCPCSSCQSKQYAGQSVS